MLEAAPVSSRSQLYSEEMAENPDQCGIIRTETKEGEVYAVISEKEAEPIEGLSRWQQEYFFQWVAQGRPQMSKEEAAPLMMLGEDQKENSAEARQQIEKEQQQEERRRMIEEGLNSSSSQERAQALVEKTQLLQQRQSIVEMRQKTTEEIDCIKLKLDLANALEVAKQEYYASQEKHSKAYHTWENMDLVFNNALNQAITTILTLNPGEIINPAGLVPGHRSALLSAYESCQAAYRACCEAQGNYDRAKDKALQGEVKEGEKYSDHLSAAESHANDLAQQQQEIENKLKKIKKKIKKKMRPLKNLNNGNNSKTPSSSSVIEEGSAKAAATVAATEQQALAEERRILDEKEAALRAEVSEVFHSMTRKIPMMPTIEEELLTDALSSEWIQEIVKNAKAEFFRTELGLDRQEKKDLHPQSIASIKRMKKELEEEMGRFCTRLKGRLYPPKKPRTWAESIAPLVHGAGDFLVRSSWGAYQWGRNAVQFLQDNNAVQKEALKKTRASFEQQGRAIRDVPVQEYAFKNVEITRELYAELVAKRGREEKPPEQTWDDFSRQAQEVRQALSSGLQVVGRALYAHYVTGKPIEESEADEHARLYFAQQQEDNPLKIVFWYKSIQIESEIAAERQAHIDKIKQQAQTEDLSAEETKGKIEAWISADKERRSQELQEKWKAFRAEQQAKKEALQPKTPEQLAKEEALIKQKKELERQQWEQELIKEDEKRRQQQQKQQQKNSGKKR